MMICFAGVTAENPRLPQATEHRVSAAPAPGRPGNSVGRSQLDTCMTVSLFNLASAIKLLNWSQKQALL